MNNFFNRIQFILGNRKVGPWSEGIGLSKPDMTRVKKGGTIGSEKLIPICRAENVSLSWLLEGKGHPYMVQHTHSDAETADLLASYIDDEDWHVLILRHSVYPAIILTQPATMLVGKKDIDYRAIEIIAGPVGSETLGVIKKSSVSDKNQVDVDEFTARKLYAGKLGNQDIFGDEENTLFSRQTALVTDDLPDAEQDVGLPSDVDIQLLKIAIQSTEDACLEDGVQLNAEQKSQVAAAIYRYMQREHTKNIDKSLIITTLDAIL